MRIFRLELRDLKRYRELQIDLAPGLTIIRGPNEAGKTTIARAIELVLTQPAGEDRPDLDHLRSWDAGAAARPTVTIDFTDDADGVTRTGSVRKVFGHGGVATLTIDTASTSDPAQVDTGLAEISGIPNAAFFRSTALVDQGELDELDRDETVLRERLTASISAADGDTRLAVHALEEALADLHGHGEGDPGRLHIAEEAVNRSETIVAAGEAAMAKLVDDRLALGRTEEALVAARDQLADRKDLLEQARRAETLQTQLTAATERHDRYAEAVTVDEALHVLHRTHPSPEPLAVLRSGVARLRGLDTKGKELAAQLSGEVQVDFQLTEPPTTWRPIVAIGVLGILAGIAVAIASILLVARPGAGTGLGTTTAVLLAVGAGIALVGLILLVIGLRKRRAVGVFERQKQLGDTEIDRRLRGKSQLEAELHQVEQQTKAQLGALGLSDLAEGEEMLTKEEAHVASIDEQSARLGGLVGKEPSESLPASRDAAKAEADAASAAQGELVAEARVADASTRFAGEVEAAEAALEAARSAEANARAAVHASTVDAGQVAGEAERLAAWRGQLETLRVRARVHEAALRGLERSIEATMDRATRYLEKRMAEGVIRITDGRYRRVRIADDTLEIELFSPEKADWVNARDLSDGTLAQAYLVARLGLIRHVTGNRRPPLVLDDPFVSFDDARAARAFAILRDFTRDFQVIYLTSSDRYDAAADAIVELPGPTAVDPVEGSRTRS